MLDPHTLADVPARRMLAPITLALAFAFGAPAVASNSFYAVVPVSGVNAQEQLRPVKIALASATPPAAHVGESYEFTLGALLSLDGPEGTEPGKVTWSVVSGELPAGLSLVGDRVVGTPTELAPGRQIVIRAEHPDAQGMVGAMASYSFAVPVVALADMGGYRAWADGMLATSCDSYLHSADPLHPYQGATGDGVYRVSGATGGPIDVFCDQTTDGGGWALLMKQAANDGATLQGDTTYWTNGTVLNDTAAGRSMADGNFVSPAFARLAVMRFRLQAANEAAMRYHDNAQPLYGRYAFGNTQISVYTDGAYVLAPSLPNWFVHATTYPDGRAITAARFGFNFTEYYPTSGAHFCGARWGWAANQDGDVAGSAGSYDVCGGLGGYGSRYGSLAMNGNKSAWQPATLYLWGR
ncbi:fibrinogen-like YCDxxxxGGGW domain-containing protein [Castellaniella sp.]|uniref:fibrinogen-like YCDxxxxGGGW domain-containing protein n=1 Tax=Castellaniella sp. TaxID=1955812 RepID=UPI003C734CAB